MDIVQITGVSIIITAYGLMLALLIKSKRIIEEIARRKMEQKRRYFKKKIKHVREVQRDTRAKRR